MGVDMKKQPLMGSGQSHPVELKPLEARVLLSVNPVGSQPTGNLAGKIVYLHRGHRWTAESNG
jgi:hypothetical protein